MHNRAYRNVGCHFFGTCSACLLSICLCDHPYESLYRFVIEIWNYMMHGYCKGERSS
ncbi:hypothetical protein HU200_008256 [Digitaria exilis]|uniref:Uncharacterized protein n=1 Tax=Digitaria exilis TaxID=1010633 RepID=A0A835KRV1_9POAL|nr:hypothetical protein HU200_008256 [Digitaria exilis]